MNTEIISSDDPRALSRTAKKLKQGGLVAFPTDTVYGLGALVNNLESIQELYTVKERDRVKAVPILLSALTELTQVAADISDTAQRLAERFWPGPLTIVVPRHPALPKIVSPYSTIGVRMPDHPLALNLLRITGPLAVTSANQSGEASTRTAQEVLTQLGGRIPLILDGGRTPGSDPSTVVDTTKAEIVILRAGPLTMQELKSALS